jgi:hypothetical protein
MTSTSISDSLPIQLECRGARNTTFRFHVTLDPIAIAVLVEVALAGLRIYELMMIRRPGDILKYLWVRFGEVPDRVIERRQSRFIRLQEYQRWPEGMMPFEEFSGMFFWAGDDTEEEDECWLGYWWRRRESNPRPKVLYSKFYILSLVIWF